MMFRLIARGFGVLVLVSSILSGVALGVGRTLSMSENDCIATFDSVKTYLVDKRTAHVITQPRGAQIEADAPLLIFSPDYQRQLQLSSDDLNRRIPTPLILVTPDGEKVVHEQVWLAKWSGDGRYFVYLSGETDLHLMMADADGNTVGETPAPEAISRDLTLTPPYFSADDRYLMVNDRAFIRMYAIPELTPIAPETLDELRFHSWSPTGHLLLALRRFGIVLFSPEAGILAERQPVGNEVILDPVWSQNSEWAVIPVQSRGAKGLQYTLDLLHISGEMRQDFISPRVFGDNPYDSTGNFLLWDQNTIYTWRGTPDVGYELVRYEPESASSEVLASGIILPGIFPNNGWTSGWRVYPEQRYSLEFFELATGRAVPVIANIEKPAYTLATIPDRFIWSSDQQYAVVLHQDPQPNTDLGWVNLATGEGDQISFDGTVSIIGWWGNHTLIYIAAHDNEMWAGTIDVTTNTHTLLLEPMRRVGLVISEPDRLMLYWEAADSGYSIWEAGQTEPLLRITLPPVSNTPRASLTNSFSARFSPDEQLAIANRGQELYLLFLDGSQPPKLLSNATYNFPVWSYDGSAIAIAEFTQSRRSILTFDAAGEPTQRFQFKNWVGREGGQPEWRRCRQ